jgi:hypothetical protein
MMGFRTQLPWSSSAAGAGAQADPMCDAAAAVVAARQGMETPLTAVAEAFEELARGMEADGGELRLAPFGDTCALVSVLFNSLGIAFKFAESEYVTKVHTNTDLAPIQFVFFFLSDQANETGKSYPFSFSKKREILSYKQRPLLTLVKIFVACDHVPIGGSCS